MRLHWYSLATGRLGKGAQPLLVLDGRQLGPICKIVPLPLPRALLAGRAANADDAARNLFFQVASTSHLSSFKVRNVMPCKRQPQSPLLPTFHNVPCSECSPVVMLRDLTREGGVCLPLTKGRSGLKLHVIWWRCCAGISTRPPVSKEPIRDIGSSLPMIECSCVIF